MSAAVRLAFVGMHPARRRDLEAARGGPDALLAGILDGSVAVPEHALAVARRPAEDLLQSLTEDVTLILDGDRAYPTALRDLPDRPAALFLRGERPDGPSVAVVGARRATRYGLGLAEALAGAYARAGYTVVSGLAAGVDTRAHRGAIEAGGRTVAVLGHGTDHWYPAANRALGRSIAAESGAVVTEYPPPARPAPWRFPLRNRIISGLAAAVVVVEATVTGGALITARSALAQGRDVLAVPGDLDRPTSEGCNRLIADGAVPITSIEEAVAAVDVITGRVPVPRRTRPLADVLGPTGTRLDDLGSRLGLGASEVLATVGRWEVEGLARVDAGRVIAID